MTDRLKLNSLEQQNPTILGLIMLFFYLIFRPTQLPVFDTFYLIYLFALPAGLSLLVMLLKTKSNSLLLTSLGVCVLFTVITAVHIFIESRFNKSLLFLWPAWFCIVALTYYLSRCSKDICLSLRKPFQIILILQLAIALVQPFNPYLFDFVWPSEETRGLVGFNNNSMNLRVTGSLSAPLLFAMYCSFMMLVIISRDGPVKNWFWVVLTNFLICLSASRTMMLIYPFLVSLWFYFQGGVSISKRLVMIVLSSMAILFITVIMAITINEVSDFITYQARYSDYARVLEKHGTGYADIYLSGVTSPKTLLIRFEYWTGTIDVFSQRDLLSILFGEPFGPEINTHSDYFAIINNYGVVGLLVFICFYMNILRIASKKKHYSEFRVLYLVSVMLMLTGLVNSISTQMTMAVILAVAVGMAIPKTLEEKTASREL